VKGPAPAIGALVVALSLAAASCGDSTSPGQSPAARPTLTSPAATSTPSSGFTAATWSGQTVGRGAQLVSVSCASSSFCVAMGGGPGNHYPQGYAYRYVDGKWRAGERVDQYTYQDSISCPTVSFCMMVDSLPSISPAGYRGGHAFTYANGRWSAGIMIDNNSSLVSTASEN
jgi:hypothetical protein